MGVEKIERSAFYNCKRLTDVYFGGGESAWNRLLDNIGSNNDPLTSATIHFGSVDNYDGSFAFRSTKKGSDTQATCYYDDSFFSHSSWEYDHSLAQMSLCMALAAYDSAKDAFWQSESRAYIYLDEEPALASSPAENIVDLMNNCGFSRIMVNKDYVLTTQYDGQTNDGNNIGVCIGNKKLEDDYTLIAVAIRGGGYGDEWIGDFNVYNSDTEHVGFEIAKNKVLAALDAYVDENAISGKVKIWFCGYSRSAATSNLAAAYLCRNGLRGCSLAQTDIYAYTFETPQGTKINDTDNKIYNGIWNIVNPIDLVPQVAMTAWKYGRYGHTVFLPCKYSNYDVYRTYSKNVLKLFNEYCGSSKLFLPQMDCQNYVVKSLAQCLAGVLISDSSALMKAAQIDIQAIWKHGQLTDEDLVYVLPAVLTAVLALLTPQGGAAAVGVIGTVIVGAMNIGPAHYPELCLAWMNTINNVDQDGTIRYAISNCPVDLAVYDGSGVLQLRIIDDEVIYEDGAYIEAIVDWDGQKVICIPEDVEISIEVLATDDGTFSWSVQEYGLAAGEVTKVVNYNEIPITEGEKLKATVSDAAGSEYLLYDGDGEKLSADEVLTGDAVKTYTVTVEAEGPGSVTGTSVKTKGEFAQAVAEPEEGARFVGWYAGDTLVSTETVYRFPVTADTSLKAVFSEAGLPGDVNGDGAADGLDAALILQHAAGLPDGGSRDWSAGDVNSDGAANAADAAQLLR